MTGTLGRISVLPAQPHEQVVANFQSVLPQALDAFAQRGLNPPQLITGFSGDLPAHITDLTDQQLGEYLSQFSSYCAYLDMEYAKASILKASALGILKQAQALVRISIKSAAAEERIKLTVDERNDMMEADPRIQQAEFNFQYADAFCDLVRATQEKGQRNWETVSRHITLRGQGVERGRREISAGGIPAGFGRTFHP